MTHRAFMSVRQGACGCGYAKVWPSLSSTRAYKRLIGSITTAPRKWKAHWI